MNNTKIFILIFAIFISIFFLTGCFEKQEDVKEKTTTTSSEKQKEKKENNNLTVSTNTNTDATNTQKMKEGIVIRPGGYGVILPLNFELDTSASSLIYKNKKENIKVEFSENQFNKKITIEEFGAYAQNLHRSISQNLEIKYVESNKNTTYPFFVISAFSAKEQKNFLIYGFLANDDETAYMSLWEFNSNDQTAESKIKNIVNTFNKYQ